MQNFIVVASLVSELAGGQNDPPPLVLNVTKNTLVLWVKVLQGNTIIRGLLQKRNNLLTIKLLQN